MQEGMEREQTPGVAEELCNAASGTWCDCCAREFTAAMLTSPWSSHSKRQHRGSGTRALTLTWRLLRLIDYQSVFCRVGATGRFFMLQRMTPQACSYLHTKSTRWGVLGFKTKGAVEVGAGALWRCLGELEERNEGWTWSNRTHRIHGRNSQNLKMFFKNKMILGRKNKELLSHTS